MTVTQSQFNQNFQQFNQLPIHNYNHQSSSKNFQFQQHQQRLNNNGLFNDISQLQQDSMHLNNQISPNKMDTIHTIPSNFLSDRYEIITDDSQNKTGISHNLNNSIGLLEVARQTQSPTCLTPITLDHITIDSVNQYSYINGNNNDHNNNIFVNNSESNIETQHSLDDFDEYY